MSATLEDRVVGIKKIALVLVEVVFVASGMNVDEVVWDFFAIYSVFAEVFASAEVHATIDLARVGTNDFAIYLCSKVSGEGSFATCGRTENSY